MFILNAMKPRAKTTIEKNFKHLEALNDYKHVELAE